MRHAEYFLAVVLLYAVCLLNMEEKRNGVKRADQESWVSKEEPGGPEGGGGGSWGKRGWVERKAPTDLSTQDEQRYIPGQGIGVNNAGVHTATVGPPAAVVALDHETSLLLTFVMFDCKNAIRSNLY